MGITILTSALKYKWSKGFREGLTDDCWPFKGYCGKDGTSYGQIKLEQNKKIIRCGAHRISYMFFNRLVALDELILVCHSCDNPPCQNPGHLFTGDNVADMVTKGRQVKGEKQHLAKLTDELAKQMLIDDATGFYSQRDLAEKYHVNQQTVWAVLNGITWKHI